MIGKARYYIFYNYFKYIFIIFFIFIGLIWLSQIIRIIEFQYSFSYQIFDVAISTLFALPSFTNPLVPFLILIGSFLVNTKLSNDNEIIILKQYLSENRLNALFYFLTFIIFIFFTINSEIISKKFYEKYKIKELEIRNNLKLGTPSQKEFHIGEIASIFFEEEKNQVFYNVNAIINYENQFITAESVEIEISKNNFNLTLLQSQRTDLETTSNVNFIQDYLTTEQVTTQLNDHKIHLCPSIYEGWGHYLYEGMSTGALIYATKLPMFVEWIDPDLVVFLDCVFHKHNDNYPFLNSTWPHQFGWLVDIKQLADAIDSYKKHLEKHNPDKVRQFFKHINEENSKKIYTELTNI